MWARFNEAEGVRAALKEADKGDFATDEEVATVAKKWKVNAR